MATFDFVNAASKGYEFLWEERAVVARLAIVPALVKFACFVAIESIDLDGNFLRQGLIMLPSYFAEGWMLAYLIRMALYEERLSSGDRKRDEAVQQERSRAVLAGLAVYVLIKLALSFIGGYVMQSTVDAPQPPPEPTNEMFVMGMIAMALMVWMFRLLWLYIPATMGYPIGEFLRKIKGYVSSFYMIGAWLICFMPFALVLLMFSELLLYVIPTSKEDPSTLYMFVIAGAQVVVEIMAAVTVTIAMAHGIRAIISGDNSRNRLF